MLRFKNSFLICIILILTSCGNGGDDLVIAAPSPVEDICESTSMSISVGGEDWPVKSVVATLVKKGSETEPLAKEIYMMARNADGIAIQFIFSNISDEIPSECISEKVYYETSFCQQFGNTFYCEHIALIFNATAGFGIGLETSSSFGPGFAEITSCNENSRSVSGTFELYIAPIGEEPIPVIGSFTNVCYQ